MAESITVIVNPAAGSGRGKRIFARLRAVLPEGAARYLLTKTAGDEERLAREAASAGAHTIVAVGGDGTWGNVAHGIMTSSARPRLALVAAGTGNDFAKSVGAPARDLRATAALIASGAARAVDVGFVGDRAFVNCCGFGFDTAVLARIARWRMLPGSAAYLAAALAELPRYRGSRIEVKPWSSAMDQATLLLVIANGEWYGGMFRIAPGAMSNDGLLDAVRIGMVGRARRLSLLAAALRGHHIGEREVQTERAGEFVLRFDAPPLVNADGELRAAASREVRVRVEPRALLVAAPLEQLQETEHDRHDADQRAERRQRPRRAAQFVTDARHRD